jgi:transposase InsO family protein
MALKRRCPETGLLHHSDQGCTYASDDYQRVLDAHGITCSMNRRGNCHDNAVMESFFSVKSEMPIASAAAARRRWSCSIMLALRLCAEGRELSICCDSEPRRTPHKYESVFHMSHAARRRWCCATC